MKKRMFLSTILMTLVLLVALTTATFAWYQATAADASQVSGSSTVTAAGNEYKAGGVTFTITATNDGKEVDMTNAAGDAKYMVGSELYDVDAPIKSSVVTVTITVALSEEGDSSLYDALVALNFSYDLKAAGVARGKLGLNEAGAIAATAGADLTIDTLTISDFDTTDTDATSFTATKTFNVAVSALESAEVADVVLDAIVISIPTLED